MYAASAQYINAIKADTVELGWNGTINTVGGNTYTFTKDDIATGSGFITRMISNQSLKLGTVFSSSLSIELILPSVSRYELYGATIKISNTVVGASDDIPMGEFTINKATQSADHINISADDYMLKLAEVPFSASLNNTIQKPYAWLTQICAAAGVTLGMTSAQVEALPNGSRKTGFADSVADAKTWRDVLSYLGIYLASYSYIGRDGKLYLGQYKASSDDTINQYFRYSSGLSDFRTTYNGLYAIYKNEGIQEYVSNANAGGLVLDIGTNPFLQFSNAANRQEALQEIIDAWNGVYYVPYQSEVGIIPILDPGDVLTFTGNQADAYDYGAITKIVYNLNTKGRMTVVCAGDNPYLAAAQDRFSKTVEGLSADYSTGQEIGTKNFWLLHTHTIANNNIGSTKTLVAQIEFEQKTDVQRMGFMFDCDGDLSASAVIKVEMTVDDEVVWTEEYTDRRLAGKIPFPHNMGQRITGKGTHIAKVYMTVTDSKLKWSELA
jgi:hypothetical protein